MTKKTLKWQPDLSYPAGKGATEQRFTSTANGDDLEIDTHPWGEADLKINHKQTAHVDGKPSAGDAFREAEDIAEKIEGQKTKDEQASLKS